MARVSDELESTTGDVSNSEPTRREANKNKRAAMKAEVEAARAANQAERDAKRQAAAVEKETKAAAKQAAKHAAEDARRARKQAKQSRKNKAADGSGDDAVDTDKAKPTKQPKVKEPKDPYRPRFAVAPTAVRVFVLASWLIVVAHLLAAAAFASVAAGQLAVDVAVSSTVLWALTAALSVNTLVLVSGVLGMCRGTRTGWRAGLLGVLVGVWVLPFSLVAALALLARDARDWAI